jgi:hypothetical protein
MVDTNQFKLPLLDAAQAQKHVTVNEALARLDTAVQLRLVSISETVPPVTAVDGVAYYVPTGAVNAWDGHIGDVAIFANGGWVFLTPKIGWRAWVEDIGNRAMFDGLIWRHGLVTMSPGGAGTVMTLNEFDHVITPGAVNSTLVTIEDATFVLGVSGRILTDIAGTGITDWKLGVEGAGARFGSDLTLTAGTWITGMASKPQTYWGGRAVKTDVRRRRFHGRCCASCHSRNAD